MSRTLRGWPQARVARVRSTHGPNAPFRRLGDVPAVKVDQIFAEERRLLGRECLIGTVSRPIPVDKQIGNLFGGVAVFGAIVPFEMVIPERRTEPLPHLLLVAHKNGLGTPAGEGHTSL